MSRTVVIGLDGAAWHLLEPLLEKGVMPRLQALRARGAAGILDSTVPTYTPPAWTSAVTGVNPGRHGVYGFVQGHAQDERRELMHSGNIRAATLWEIANAQGVRTGIYNLPLTYPPRPLDGWMVSGMMTPGYGERQRGFTSPRELEDHILSWAPDYVLDVNANYEQDWRNEDLCLRAIASVKQREKVLRELLTLDPVDILFSVLETPDRLQHVYYRYMNPSDDLYDTPAARALRPRIEECFAAMDRVVGLLDDYAGGGGSVIVCSDHGFTAWEVTVHVNALLQKWGYLKMKPRARVLQSPVARSLVPIAKRFLPRNVAREAKNKTNAVIDWRTTRAFASPIPQQGIFVNLAGRERCGIVPSEQLEPLKDEIARRFGELKGPDGEPATDRVYRSQDVFHGDDLTGAPDILPVMRDHRFELDDEVFHRDPFTDVRHLPRGVHHFDGMVIVAGPGVDKKDIHASVLDITPTVLYLAGLAVPDGLDGAVITSAFDDDFLAGRPIATTAPLSSETREESSPYSKEEEALIEESLRGLGYL